LRLGQHGAGPGWRELSHSLISGNTFKNNGSPAISVDGGFNGTFLGANFFDQQGHRQQKISFIGY
jgi:hypothetical protein